MERVPRPARPGPPGRRLITLAAVGFLLAGCSGTASAPTWTFGPTLPATSAAPSAPAAASASPAASSSAGAEVSPTPTAPASSAPTASPGASGTPKPFSGRMDPHVLLVNGYITTYMTLQNTGTEPLTFLNTLYDTEPTKLYAPTVAYTWQSGDAALTTRAGKFFPSPAIVQPGHSAVYLMGGQLARGSGVLAPPNANIKFCPTRGMDDIPSVPVQVKDLAWTTANGMTTVTGMLVETEGSERPDPPIVGVAFFDKAGTFVGAVVDGRVGDRLAPRSSVPFEIQGPGVDVGKIDHASAWAYVS